MQIPRKLLPLVKKKKRFKVIIGGRGSGKSHTVADICLMDAQTKGIKTGCFREFQNSISDSVYSLLSDEIERLDLKGFDIQNNVILNNGQDSFTFKGMARNPESIKSMHGYERFFIEEAQTISYKSLKMLTPTLRIEGSEVWLVGNPASSADPFSQRFIIPFQKELDKHGYYEDDLHLIIVCNYMDNPFFPEVLEDERKYDLDHLDRAEYDHIWLGKFNDSIANSIIKVEWFDACIDAHKKLGFKPLGATIVSHDPSDTGKDDKGIAIRKGAVFLEVDSMATGDVNEGCDWATNKAIKYNADLFTWDCDGLGVSLNRQVSESFQGIKTDVKMFKGSMSVDNPDQIYQPHDNIAEPKTNKQTFRNKRSQYYWRLRDRFYNTYRAVVKGEYIDPDELISLDSGINNLQGLRSEICRIPLKLNGSGMIQIMSKDEMLKLGIASPNMADSLMMAMEIPEIIDEWKELKYESVSMA